ncbi:Uncharacterised protein [Legionella beliardensis]|uniref:DUF4116 domain-containing protein n=1 Tax=Legionella beliardensis TaxID=91822 RepID=A0A378I1D1_9GAMM|nr:DUF4116 domain-containing protein [Legionella beliardensis]STX28541.1 Uncharacterised protein [Legionella beliardensis]
MAANEKSVKLTIHQAKVSVPSPIQKKSFESYLAEVERNWQRLDNVPAETPGYKEICLAAIRKNYAAFKYVSQKMDTKEYKEICLEVMKKNGLFIKYASQAMKEDRKVCLAAVQQNPEAFLHIFETRQHDKEICLAAVTQNWEVLKDIPPDQKDKDIYLAAVKQNGLLLKDFPQSMKEDKDICFAAVKQNYEAFQWVSEELRVTILQEDNYVEDMLLRHSYNLRLYFSPEKQQELASYLDYLDARYQDVLKTCNMIIFQPHEASAQLEDISHMYTHTHGAGHSMYVRNISQLQEVLDQLGQMGKGAIYFSLVGHAHLEGATIAGLPPDEIASLASKYPIIKQITLLGCKTAGSNERLDAEVQNAQEFANQRAVLAEKIKAQYPLLFTGDKEKENEKRLEVLVNDLIWQTGERFCGVRVISEDEKKITPKMLIKKGLHKSLDAAYVFVRNNKTNCFAVYYLTRGADGVECTCLTKKLKNEQVLALQAIPDLTTCVKGERKAKKRLFATGEATDGWCTNKKGDAAALNETATLNALATLLNHSRDKHYSELADFLKDHKRSFRKCVELSVASNDVLKLMPSFAGRLIKELQALKTPSSVKVVKGYRDLIYSDQRGLINTISLQPFKQPYNQSFFGRPSSNINPDAIKKNLIVTEKQGGVKSVKIKL